VLPQEATNAEQEQLEAASPYPSQSQTSVASSGDRLQFRSETNDYGLYRIYYDHRPSYDPDLAVPLDNVCDSGHFNVQPDASLSRPWWSPFGKNPDTAPTSFFAPFLNATVFRLMSWFYSISSLKSLTELQRLVDDVINQDDFRKEDLAGFNAKTEAERLDTQTIKSDATTPSFLDNDGWIVTSVKIPVSCPGFQFDSEEAAPIFEVADLYIRRPLNVLKTAIEEISAERMHIRPFELWWQENADSVPERCYSELYNSDVFLEEQRKLDDSRGFSDMEQPTVENVIAGYMFYSDSTHLANFGTASLWPAYTAFGNISKYIRCKPTSFSIHHQAYFPKVSVRCLALR
jgi:hypothetical protein